MHILFQEERMTHVATEADVLLVPEDLGRVFELGDDLNSGEYQIRFSENSMARFLGTTTAALADVHMLGLWHAADPVISSAAIRRGASDTFRRYRDSSALIAAVTLADHAPIAAHVLHNIHEGIQGVDADGNEVSALDPLHFANADVRNWWHGDQAGQRMRLSAGALEEFAFEKLIQFRCTGVDSTYYPVGRAALKARAEALFTQHVERTPLFEQLISETEPVHIVGKVSESLGWPLSAIIDTVFSRPLHFVLTDVSILAMPPQLRETLDIDVNAWAPQRLQLAKNAQRMLRGITLAASRSGRNYLHTHPDLADRIHGQPQDARSHRELQFMKRFADAVTGEPRAMVS